MIRIRRVCRRFTHAGQDMHSSLVSLFHYYYCHILLNMKSHYPKGNYNNNQNKEKPIVFNDFKSDKNNENCNNANLEKLKVKKSSKPGANRIRKSPSKLKKKLNPISDKVRSVLNRKHRIIKSKVECIDKNAKTAGVDAIVQSKIESITKETVENMIKDILSKQNNLHGRQAITNTNTISNYPRGILPRFSGTQSAQLYGAMLRMPQHRFALQQALLRGRIGPGVIYPPSSIAPIRFPTPRPNLRNSVGISNADAGRMMSSRLRKLEPDKIIRQQKNEMDCSENVHNKKMGKIQEIPVMSKISGSLVSKPNNIFDYQRKLTNSRILNKPTGHSNGKIL